MSKCVISHIAISKSIWGNLNSLQKTLRCKPKSLLESRKRVFFPFDTLHTYLLKNWGILKPSDLPLWVMPPKFGLGLPCCRGREMCGFMSLRKVEEEEAMGIVFSTNNQCCSHYGRELYTLFNPEGLLTNVSDCSTAQREYHASTQICHLRRAETGVLVSMITDAEPKIQCTYIVATCNSPVHRCLLLPCSVQTSRRSVAVSIYMNLSLHESIFASLMNNLQRKVDVFDSLMNRTRTQNINFLTHKI